MRAGRFVAALLLAVGALLVPTTSAQAAASCAPAEDQWLGTYRGTHYYDSGAVFGVLDVTVYRDNGVFRASQDTWSTRAFINEEGLLQANGGWFFGLKVATVTCDSDGTVTNITGFWLRNNNNPECATCIIHGPFEGTRV